MERTWLPRRADCCVSLWINMVGVLSMLSMCAFEIEWKGGWMAEEMDDGLGDYGMSCRVSVNAANHGSSIRNHLYFVFSSILIAFRSSLFFFLFLIIRIPLHGKHAHWNYPLEISGMMFQWIFNVDILSMFTPRFPRGKV